MYESDGKGLNTIPHQTGLLVVMKDRKNLGCLIQYLLNEKIKIEIYLILHLKIIILQRRVNKIVFEEDYTADLNCKVIDGLRILI